ncbi:MAG: DUF937 domain-containing protein [Acidobacteriota bacterium]|nr:DUF937 domain-containing protein [Acidobacteriota bacterium]
MDDSTSILDALQAQLGPDTIQKMSGQLGTDTAATSNAISMALPILLGGLSKNSANAEGAAALDNALTAHDGGILDNLSALLSSGGGGAILAHILGPRRTAVEDGVGRATGMDAPRVGQLLMMLAPLVMGVLGKMKREQNVDAEKLPAVLGQANLEMARQSTAVSDLSRILDGNHDGQIADDIARIGTSVLGGLLGQAAS